MTSLLCPSHLYPRPYLSSSFHPLPILTLCYSQLVTHLFITTLPVRVLIRSALVYVLLHLSSILYPFYRFCPLNGFPLSTTNCYSFILIIRPIPFLWQCHCFVPAFVVLSMIRLPILLGSSIAFFLQLSIDVRFLHWTLGCALHSLVATLPHFLLVF